MNIPLNLQDEFYKQGPLLLKDQLKPLLILGHK